ncbi:hypothetical protein [Pseudomonas syringae]|uniref:hypothetical protein n=1 Tax=Pseudomonas syringae TaxID=317 RepID=UPI000A30D8C1|nr:hypothetical protein [Pseudomonas syringae]MBL3871789.1 hypothetical protein [Pseudomonas syringae pv. theae]GKQ30131.1 hypothetical protein PSTH68_11450 [Pseudomonas syringae pv. theae]
MTLVLTLIRDAVKVVQPAEPVRNRPAAICLVILASLLFYDKKKEKIAPAGKVFIKVLARSMVVVWACALLLAVASFNKPLPLRIDRTVHPTTQQFSN